MPELPEVETVVRGLQKKVLGLEILEVIKNRPKLRYDIDPEIKQKLTNRKITEITRRGKHVLMKLGAQTAIIHFGMTGSLQVKPSEEYEQAKHDHIILHLSQDKTLFYNDARRFGYWFLTDDDPLAHKCFLNYAPEPLTQDFNPEYLFEKLKTRNITIKQAVMDNKLVVGVGNIYASECLHLSKLNPMKKCGSLKLEQVNLLVENIKLVLEKAIQNRGTTFRDYKTDDGTKGSNVEHLYVYGRDKQECLTCKKSKIQSKVIAQRNTFYCPSCQK